MRLRPVALGLLGVLAIAGRSLLGRANLTSAATDAEAVGCDIRNARERAERQGAGHAVWR